LDRFRGSWAGCEAAASSGTRESASKSPATIRQATATSAIIGVVEMTLRFEIFPDDLDATVDFYMRVLRFRLIADRRDEPSPYVSLQRGSVRVGAARRAVPDARATRLPPAGVELVLEVDDVVAERDQITAAGWPITEDLRDRPWGLRDFRVLDPAGYYLRITDRAR
jgi:lactoylglutathione lyase